MLLFDVALITYAICGRVKDVLSKLVGFSLTKDKKKLTFFNQISELPLTMVVCGSRGRGSMKG